MDYRYKNYTLNKIYRLQLKI